jgi:hypothetical protein
MKRFFKLFGLIILVIVVGLLIWLFSNLKDRNPGYKADLKIISENLSVLYAGFAAVPITPDVPDRWTDTNGKQLALLVLDSLENPVEEIDAAAISLIIRTISLPIKNSLGPETASLLHKNLKEMLTELNQIK